jgi:hypothetical protein
LLTGPRSSFPNPVVPLIGALKCKLKGPQFQLVKGVPDRLDELAGTYRPVCLLT